jgi:3-hydroxyisobutyrate dehydrogenase-like beta-hydroxyacid dehydrogenase
MRIAFLGLGNMGQPMARNLLRAGHELTLWNRSRGATEALAKDGAHAAETPAQTAARCEIAITMLADDRAVESVVFGESGLAEGLPKGSFHISSSTISPDLSERLTLAHQERGQQYIAAPVFGRPDAAAAAKLFIVAAGDKDAVAKAQPIFDALGQRTFYIDEQPAHANFVKLFGNFLITCVLESLGEVFAVSRKAGIEPQKVLEVLTGTLFNAPIYQNYGRIIVEERFSPAGFKLPLGLKDVRLALAAAEKLSVPMPFGNIVRDRFLTAISNGMSELDWAALTRVIAESAGLRPDARER